MAKNKRSPNNLTPAQWNQMLADADRNWHDYIERWPPAKSVRYDRTTKRIVVQLVNGMRLEIPARKLQGVASGTERERADVHCIGAGTCLEWRSLDQHFSIEGLLTGHFGNKSWMASLGRKQVRTNATQSAAPQLRRKRTVTRRTADSRS